MKAQILFIDDEPRVLDALRRTLREYSERWEMAYCSLPEVAWEKMQRGRYDAVVTDIHMPGLTGFELLQRMRQEEPTKDVPVVILTGLNDRNLAECALNLGAVDLLSKPVNLQHLVARLESMLRLKGSQDALKAYNNELQQQVRRQSIDLLQARLNLVCRLSNAAECRDERMGNHAIRVGYYSQAIAARLGLPPLVQERILLTAPLHDIGKIGIPDQILLKAGPLSPAEWNVMQRHCVIGEQILRSESRIVERLLEGTLDGDAWRLGNDPLLEMAACIALTHHEKWDGSGYPTGLCGEEIPWEARIVALADVFDDLTSLRPCKAAAAEGEALERIRSTAGSHFAPEAYAAFEAALPEIRQIRARWADGCHPWEHGEDAE